MTVFTESIHAAEFLVSEAPGTTSREQVTVTVAGSTPLVAGTVLAKLTATGKYVPYDNAGSDGSEAAFGILYATLVNDSVSPADIEGVVINWSAEVRRLGLTWNSGVDAAGKLAGLADLAARGIKALE